MKTILWVMLFLYTSVLFAEVLFYDNFNRADGAVGNSWTNIGSATTTIENNALMITSPNGAGIRRDFTSITSGIHYIQFDWKVVSTDWYADAFPTGLTTHLVIDSSGNLYYDSDGTMSDPVLLQNVGLGVSVTVLMKIDLDLDVFSVWINNNLATENTPGNVSASFYRFSFRGMGVNTVQYIDNFMVFNTIAPTGLAATGYVNHVSLNWPPAPYPDPISYRIYRDTSSPAQTFLAEIDGSNFQYTDTSAIPNAINYYRITALHSESIETEFSNEASAHMLPDINVAPTNIELNVGSDYSDSTYVSVYNTGDYPLDWSFVPSTPSEDDLIAYYSFDGTASDGSGNNHHGSLINGATFTTDRNGNPNSCLLLDGINDYVDIGDWIWGGPSTFSVWVFNTSSPSGQRIIGFSNSSNNDCMVLYRQTNNRIVMFHNNTSTGAGYSLGWDYPNSFPVNIWLHFAVTFESNNVSKLYVNGSLLDQHFNYPPDSVMRVNQLFGKSVFGDAYYKGMIDEFRMYNRALSPTEIISLYNNAPSPYSITPSSGSLLGALQQQVLIQYTTNITTPVTITDTLYVQSNSPGTPMTPIIATINIDVFPPMPVDNLTFNPDTSDANQIGITWTQNAVADSVVSYKIFRRGRDEAIWRHVGTVPNSQLWFIDNQFTGLDSTYVYYQVRAVDWVGNIGPVGSDLMAALERFLAPENVQIENINDRDIHLTWNPVTHTISGLPGTPTCYVIYKSQYPSPTSDFDFLSISFTNEFTHQWALFFQPLNRLFYIVTAYGGDLGRMQSLVARKKEWKYGELERALHERSAQNLNIFK